MTKKTNPGSEVDAWCTKCKLDLNHRIIAMEGDRIARVECLTCRGHHQYRRPKSAPAAAGARKTARKPAAARATSRSTRLSAEAKLRESWEQAIMGRAASDFTAYKLSAILSEGELLRHKKFGDGVVIELLEGGKVSVLFEPGTKTLIHGR